MLIVGAWIAAGVLLLRAVPTLVGDALVVSGLVVPDRLTAADERLLRWDLALRSPFFAAWGVLWRATAWHQTRTHRKPIAPGLCGGFPRHHAGSR